jgi:hypothetical protein
MLARVGHHRKLGRIENCEGMRVSCNRNQPPPFKLENSASICPAARVYSNLNYYHPFQNALVAVMNFAEWSASHWNPINGIPAAEIIPAQSRIDRISHIVGY